MSGFHCVPDVEDVIAQRRLSDGRHLAVFRLWDTVQETGYSSYVQRIVAGEVVVYMRLTRTFMRTAQKLIGYALVVEDDHGMPEKWRTLAVRHQRPAILKLFTDFKEGDDDRRKLQIEEHPGRRESDG